MHEAMNTSCVHSTMSVTTESLGIADDAHAVRIILRQIDNIQNCIGGLSYEGADSPSLAHVPAVIERAIDVIALALSTVTSDVTDKLDADDRARVSVLAERIKVVGNPLPLRISGRSRRRYFPNLNGH